jgi:hypothetical protein
LQQHDSHIADPNSVLQQVWQGDYPNIWRVFSSNETASPNPHLYSLVILVVLIPLIALFLFLMASTPQLSWLIVLFLFVLFATLIFFMYRLRQPGKSKQPKPTMVVLSDRVVEYRQQRIRTLVFAEINYMRLRVEGYQEAPPSILLDISHYNGQRLVWVVDIAPADMIAQCILDAYTTYRVQFHQ